MVKFRYFLKNWNLALKDDSFLAFLTEVGVPGPTHQAAKAHRATHRPPLLFRGRSISSFFISFVAPPPSLTTPLHLLPGPPLAKREAAGRYHNGTGEKNGGLLTQVRGSDPALLFFALTPRLLLPLQAFESLLQLYEARATYEEFCIPMCMLPATISNNVPGTDLSIGADTALNAIVEVRLCNSCQTDSMHDQSISVFGNTFAVEEV